MALRRLNGVINVLAGLAIAGIMFAVATAHAQAKPRSVEELTVGHFRSWHPIAQSAYVLGVYSFASYAGLRCPGAPTVGAYQDALVHNAVQIIDTDPLAKAMLALFIRNGCEVR